MMTPMMLGIAASSRAQIRPTIRFSSALIERAEIELAMKPVGVASDVFLHSDHQDLLIERDARHVDHCNVDELLGEILVDLGVRSEPRGVRSEEHTSELQ